MQYVFLLRSSAGGKNLFLTAGARAYQKHVLHGQETVSIFLLHYLVLRPTGKVNGEAQILTPCKIYTS